MKIIDEPRLARAPPFRLLDPCQLVRVRDLARAERAQIGTVVFDEGQPAGRFYLLLAGHVRLVRMTAKGEQIIVLHVPAGQLFGISAPLGQTTRQETAIAADDCRLPSRTDGILEAASATGHAVAALSRSARKVASSSPYSVQASITV